MYSEKVREAVVTLLHENGGNVHNACKAAGITRKTFYEWKKTDVEFNEAVEEAGEIAIDNVESAFYKNALEGNVAAQIFFLKVRGRKRGWVEKVGIEIPDFSKLTIEITGTPEENPEPLDDDEE